MNVPARKDRSPVTVSSTDTVLRAVWRVFIAFIASVGRWVGILSNGRDTLILQDTSHVHQLRRSRQTRPRY